MKTTIFTAVLVIICALGAGCGASTLDCDAIATDEAACMNDASLASCKATNDECEESGGEVVQLDSCPLQFACAERP